MTSVVTSCPRRAGKQLKEDRARRREAHQPLIDDEPPEGEIACGALALAAHRRPYICVDDLRAEDALVGIVREVDGPTGLSRDLARLIDDRRCRFVEPWRRDPQLEAYGG